MSTVKISQLAEITQLDANTANSLFMGVDIPTGVTGKFTAHVLAQGLYSNEVLNVGNNAIVLPDVAAQFAGRSEAYVQINHQNLNGNGSGDIVVTANEGTDSTYYVDMGINGNTYNYDGYTYAKPLDGYLIVQGKTSADPGGNLVMGTTTEGKDILFVNGSIDDSEVVMKYVYHEGLHLMHKPVYFADGTSQNTAAQASNITVASFNLANSVNTYARTANTFLQANDATTLALATSRGEANAGAALAAAKVYTNTANTFLQANDFTTFTESKSYTDWIVAANTVTMYNYSGTAYAHANAANVLASASYTQANTTATALTVTDSVAQGAFTRATAANNMVHSAYAKANNALANTSGTFGGDLNISGNLTVLGVGTTGLFTVNAAPYPANTTAFKISGSANGFSQTPANQGYMLQITGYQDTPTRLIIDSFGANTYSLIAGRSGRGTALAPQATANGDVLMRVSSGGYGTTGFTPLGSGRMDFVAVENYTDSARGTEIQFWNTIPGTNTLNKIVTMNSTHTEVSGYIKPTKGFIWYPRTYPAAQTAVSLSFVSDAVIRVDITADMTVSFGDHLSGKIVDMWVTNTSGTNRTLTHGCTALHSTTNSTTVTVPATSTMMLKFICFDETTANVHVAAIYG